MATSFSSDKKRKVMPEVKKNWWVFFPVHTSSSIPIARRTKRITIQDNATRRREASMMSG
ncbi:hypothetical protein CHS0354_008023, partial [Potamilus streckersoni]